jgi:hypothetical protein
MSVADWTLLAAVATLVATCVGIGVAIFLNRGDRATATATLTAVTESKAAALATKAAIEAAQVDFAQTRKLNEEVRALRVSQRRTEGLVECEHSIDQLEFLLKQGLGPGARVEDFTSCQARIESSLGSVPDDMSHCKALARKPTPWSNSALIQDISSARHEVHETLKKRTTPDSST